MQGMNGPLALINTIKSAANQLWAEKKSISVLLLLVVLVDVALDLLYPVVAENVNQGWLYLTSTIQSIVYTLFAVRVHRLILAVDNPIQGVVRWTNRETRFFMWLVLGTIVLFVVSVPLIVIAMRVMAVVSAGRLGDGVVMMVMLVALMPVAYLLARLMVILPAIAIDQKRSIKWAWALTKGNGWRLAMVLWLPPALMSALPLDMWLNNTASSLVFNLVFGLVTAIEVAFFSVAFKALGGLTFAELSPDQAKEA